MAASDISIKIAAIDAFSSVFSDVQDELKDLQGQFNKAGSDMAKTGDRAAKGAKDMADNTAKSREAVGGLNGALGSMAQYVAGAFSVSAVIAFTKEAFNATLAMDSINSKLKVLTGSSEAAGQEWEFIRTEAKRLGLDLQSTADAYSTFAVATKNTSMEGEKARRVFIGVAEAATALHLPAEASSRVLYQFQQMLSKGTVSMEDLKTASESFPGLMKSLADSMGITTAALLDQMQKGEVMAADVLPKLADEFHKTYGAAAVEAADKGRGAVNKFNSSVFELKTTFGDVFLRDTPVIGWVTQFIQDITSVVPVAKNVASKLAVLVGSIFTGNLSPSDIAKQFDDIDNKLVDFVKKTEAANNKISSSNKNSAEESIRNSQRRRDEAKKSADELATIELNWSKLAGGYEVELTATAVKEYHERVRAAKAYYDQKKAAAKSNQEELDWEKVKTAKLKELAQQHARDTEIIQAQMVQRAVDLRREGLDMEIAAIKQAAADHVISERQAEQRITALTVAALRDQYEARLATAYKIRDIYGDNSEQYKKALKDQEASHKSYLDANLTAYKKYSDEIKSLDQQIADFRLSIQQKIADLRQRGMTEEAKYADNQKRFDEAVSKSREALAKGDYETAQKFAKMAEDLAGRLADKKAQTNSALEELEKQHQQKIADIQTSALGQQTDQQKRSTDIAKENAEFEAKRAQLLREQAATTEGITNATSALNTVEQLGVSIMEAKKKESENALAKLKEIQDMKLDPKNMEINLDESALARTRSTMSELTKTETKTIIIKTVQKDGTSSYKGYFAGGKVASGSPLRDSVNALLAKNEWVINNRATGFWGDGVMAAINDPLSAAGRRLQQMISGPSMAGAGGANMGTINLQIGGDAFPVQAPVNVLNQLTTAVRRMRKAGVQ